MPGLRSEIKAGRFARMPELKVSVILRTRLEMQFVAKPFPTHGVVPAQAGTHNP